MDNQLRNSGEFAAEITKASSKQTYFTIRFFADRERRADAYRAYAYFRWVDDVLDAPEGSRDEKISFIWRQRELLGMCCRGEQPGDLRAEEQMLFDLVANNLEDGAGLCSYLENMMAVMEFDTFRRGRVVSQAELDRYSHQLAVAVQDALFYFIGHDQAPPKINRRYHAVTAAHITHMLRDAHEDSELAYYNISQEFIKQQGIQPDEIGSPAYRQWVRQRVEFAREYFRVGRMYIAEVDNFRCRLAGFAYTARFEWVLDAIEQDGYILRKEYSRRKSLLSAVQIGWSTLVSVLAVSFRIGAFQPAPQPSIGIHKS